MSDEDEHETNVIYLRKKDQDWTDQDHQELFNAWLEFEKAYEAALLQCDVIKKEVKNE